MVLALTGGGSGLISQLLTTPGASNTVLECVVPYAAESLHDWLGIVPDSNCSEVTALQMAAQAQRRAVALSDRSAASSGRTVNRDAILGVGITAALATNRDRKGDERAFLAIHSFGFTRLTAFQFEKGLRSRSEEEACLADLCLQELAMACGVETHGESIQQNVQSFTSVTQPPAVAVRHVIEASIPWAMRTADKEWVTEFASRPTGLLSGSFHPLHAAHLQLADLAAEILDGPVAFELPLTNADKPPVDYCSLEKRLAEFDGRPLIVTSAPTFLEKSALFEGTTFVVGADTAQRICEPRFYNHSAEEMSRALSTINERGCSFLVAARRINGQVLTIEQLPIPKAHQSLFRPIPTEKFLLDLSSTEIRKESPHRSR